MPGCSVTLDSTCISPRPDRPGSTSWSDGAGSSPAELLRRGVHKSVAALEEDVCAWIENRNQDHKPFIWRKTAEEILDSLSKYGEISGPKH
ncbi:hypothetical protein RW1_093_00200 [Rhodococcus wratislaviensis NBRC 100605]|uniref:Transposase n=1 Tax=Rhodococcus wratislaviensis NBRC 100605 TaxID=1219028 RepID=X0Q0S3_RHOWR|nr:hypothetical protein RW1_093_00200 [Rhodococcus wratislaviensis NBRC 100605]